MKIAILAGLEEALPPHGYGGIERIASYLTEELVRQGHDVTLLASGDSETSARLWPIFPKALRPLPDMQDFNRRKIYKLIGIAKVLDRLHAESFDIINDQMGYNWSVPFHRQMGAPVVTTLHGPLTVPDERIIYEQYPQDNYISISFTQQRDFPELNYVANIYNAIDYSLFQFENNPEDYMLFFGRIAPEKGPEQAIQLARTTGQRLVIAAKLDISNKDYFESVIKPLIDGDQIQYIGEVNQTEKVHVLSKAKALLAPIQWNEPFGLYFIEAMACGTPVIALHRGSVAEIVTPGETGFICETMEEMIAAIKRIDTIDRRSCFEKIHQDNRFTIQTMASHYLKCYQSIIDRTKV